MQETEKTEVGEEESKEPSLSKNINKPKTKIANTINNAISLNFLNIQCFFLLLRLLFFIILSSPINSS